MILWHQEVLLLKYKEVWVEEDFYPEAAVPLDWQQGEPPEVSVDGGLFHPTKF